MENMSNKNDTPESLLDQAAAHAIDALRQLAHVVRQPGYPREQFPELRACVAAMRAEGEKTGDREFLAAVDDLAAGLEDGD